MVEINKDSLRTIIDAAFEESSDLKLAAKSIEDMAKDNKVNINGIDVVKKNYVNAIYDNLHLLDDETFELIKQKHGFEGMDIWEFVKLYSKVAIAKRCVPVNGDGKEQLYAMMKRVKQGVSIEEVSPIYSLSTEQ